MDRWDSVIGSEIANVRGWPSVALGQLLTERVLPVDGVPFDQLQPISISFKGNVTRRKLGAGNEYSMRLKFAPPGCVVASKIDLKNSALGVVSEDIGNAAVTSHFVVYQASDDLVPEYLHLLVQTSKLKQWLLAARSGTDGRTEVKLEIFEKLKVPLPPMGEQSTLVSDYQGAMNTASILDAEAEDLEADGLRAFEAALGIVAPPPLPDRPLFVARFSDFGRWSHEAVLRHVTGSQPQPSSYPIVALEDVIAGVSVGYSPTCLTVPADDGEWGVLKLSAVSSGKFVAHANKAVRSSADVRPALQVKAGDVLIARGSGVTKFVGAACVVTDHQSKLLLSDLIFRVNFGDAKAILPEFLACVLATPTVRRQIEETRTGAAPGIQKTTKGALLQLTFPMPTDLSVQSTLVADLSAAQSAAAALRGEALTTRRDAWRAFEAAIFGEASEISPLDETDDQVDHEIELAQPSEGPLPN